MGDNWRFNTFRTMNSIFPSKTPQTCSSMIYLVNATTNMGLFDAQTCATAQELLINCVSKEIPEIK